jgi:hypothetical protein
MFMVVCSRVFLISADQDAERTHPMTLGASLAARMHVGIRREFVLAY